MRRISFCAGIWGLVTALAVMGPSDAAAQQQKPQPAKSAKPDPEAQRKAKVAAIKEAARKAALARIQQQRAAWNKVAEAATAKDAIALKSFTDAAIREKVAADKEAAEKAEREKQEAVTALPEREAAATKAAAEAAAAIAEAEKNPNDARLTQRADQARLAAERAANAKAAASNLILARGATAERAAKQAALAEEVAAKIASGKTAKPADNSAEARRDAEQVQQFTTTALVNKVDHAVAAYEKTVAALTTAERTAATKAETVQAAQARLAEVQAVAKQAQAAKATAEAEVAAQAKAVNAAKDKNATNRAVAARKAAEKVLGQRTTLAKSVADRLAAAQSTLDKACAEKEQAEKSIADAGAAAKAAAEIACEARVLVDGGLKLLPADQWNYAKARHLLCRAGFGGTPEQVAKLHAMGLHRAVEYMVDFYKQPSYELSLELSLPPRPARDEARLSEQRRIELNARRQNFESAQMQRIRDWWLKRLVESPRQLQEKLVLFWHGHFATEFRTVRHSYAMFQQNQLLREHGATNFAALLYGIAHDPAMLRYLDNNSNVRGRPNENLAREIMELFAMGEGNYTEEDIMEGARALTGYTFDYPTGQFRYRHDAHDNEPKTIFTRTGNWSGDDFVRLILDQQETPRFIARRLFNFFVYENPNDETVHRLAAQLRKYDYEMAPMLKNLFMSAEFYGKESMFTQIKSPVQLVVGTLRDLGVEKISPAGLSATVAAMGQDLFDPPNVKGWEGGRFWVDANRIFIRYNGVADLLERVAIPDKPTRGIDLVDIIDDQNVKSSADVVKFFAKSCFVRSLSEAKIEELARYLGPLPPRAQWESQRAQINSKLRALMVLLTSMPEYQCT